MKVTQPLVCAALAAATFLSVAACKGQSSADGDSGSPPSLADCKLLSDTPVRIEGGTFAMGQDAVYAEEGPVRQTTVSSFWMDPHEVTNAQFARFVSDTGYQTVAEKPVDRNAFGVPKEQIPAHLLEPGSAVFVQPDKPSRNYSDWWAYVPGANWKKPYGPAGPDAQPHEPVVHLAWDDMVAYARWRGGRLPTEAEWEYAASAGAANYTEQPGGTEANSWQGVFPVVNEASDGFKGVAPVGCYRPNAFGLYDMVGNVWEMTADIYRPGHDPAQTRDPRGPSQNSAYDGTGPEVLNRVVKGGSYLCAPNYCQRYRPESRQARDPGLGASNVGFRLAYDTEQP